MKHHDAEDLYLRSLDAELSAHETAILTEALRANTELREELQLYLEMRENLPAKQPATFGPFFAARVLHVITQSSVVIDHYLFSFFRKFQLAAVGIVIGLLALNMVFTDQSDVISIFGFGDTSGDEGVTVMFDFFEPINESL